MNDTSFFGNSIDNFFVDKFIGDALMAVFRGDNHLAKAIAASLQIRSNIATLASNAIGFSPQVSIGINSGEMISGNIGSVTLKRLDYTVIGDTVNTAQRLESSAKDGQILINKDAYDQVKDTFSCRSIGTLMLTNKSKPVEGFEVLG